MNLTGLESSAMAMILTDLHYRIRCLQQGSMTYPGNVGSMMGLNTLSGSLNVSKPILALPHEPVTYLHCPQVATCNQNKEELSQVAESNIVQVDTTLVKKAESATKKRKPSLVKNKRVSKARF